MSSIYDMCAYIDRGFLEEDFRLCRKDDGMYEWVDRIPEDPDEPIIFMNGYPVGQRKTVPHCGCLVDTFRFMCEKLVLGQDTRKALARYLMRLR